ncbi:uncharacterized protein DUF4836 [Dysgonomonas alginatilytica]|uniref:Uncharacterized protein DUF4836 n=1 Tax=Dysgonomonas alginatilytica TaxID=1605892 RepID=A0A2V3PLN2_9BACT|nr:DUF4836 family protein [Dysgonomonas alginatilytica]PXV62822.1 uncharacterized protein DUF4836 [Dysgonomonas alginatilytica]
MTGKNIFFVIVMTLFVFASCSDSKDPIDAIPADANYVVCVDAKSLVTKSEYDIFANPMIQQAVSMYKVTLKDEAAIKLLDGFLSDANSLGVNLKNDLYFYTNYKVYGVVVGVNNADKVKDALVKFSLVQEADIKKEGGIYTVAPEPQSCLAWNGNKLLLLVDIASAYGNGTEAGEPLNLAELAKTQLKQGADKSINSNGAFAEFLKSKKDLSTFFSMKGLDKSLPDLAGLAKATEVTIPFKKFLSDIDGVSTGIYTSFENGEVKFENKYFYENAEAEKKFKDLLSQLSGNIKGDQLKYITSEPLFLASANVKGEGAYSYLEKLGFIELLTKELPESVEPDEIQKILKDLNGDITLAITSKTATKKQDDIFSDMGAPTPEFVFFADLSNPSEVIDFIKLQLTSGEMKYTELSPTNFKISSNNVDVYWGANGKTFFFTNNEIVYNNMKASNLTNNYSAVIKDKSIVMFGDLQVLQSYTANNIAFQAFGPFLSEFGKYEFASTSDLTGVGRLELATKDKNSLAVICKQLDQLISSFGGLLGR